MPESFVAILPKSGQTSGELGVLHHANKFSMEFLLGMLDLSSEYDVSVMANRVDAAICVRRRKASSNHNKLPQSKVKELTANDDNKNIMLANRVESLFPYINYIFLWRW